MEHNFNERDLNYMAEHPNAKANDIGGRLPYHLQYIRSGKPVVKPEGENENRTD